MYKIPVNEKPLNYIKNRLKSSNTPDTAVIVPTNRNLHKLVSMADWEADIQTVADFNSRSILHNGVLLPKELRSYYLYMAAKELSEHDQIKLMSSNASKFLRNYLSFVQRSSALLPFYRELKAEQIDVNWLMQASVYQDYEEQLIVLVKLWELYITKVHAAGFTDEWESYVEPVLDGGYIDRYNTYIFLISGYLNNFELLQLLMISSRKEVELYFNYTGEFHPQEARISEIFNLEGIITAESEPALAWNSQDASEGDHLINVSYTATPKNISKLDLDKQSLYTELQIVPCESMLAQYDIITRHICHAHWVEGVSLSEMAVVLPEQRMGDWFIYSDPFMLYNVSAGRPLSSFSFFEFISAVVILLKGLHNGFVKLKDTERLLLHPLFICFDENVKPALNSLEPLRERGKFLYRLESFKTFAADAFQTIYRIVWPFTDTQSNYTVVLNSIKTLIKGFLESSAEIDREAVLAALDELDKMLLLYNNITDIMPAVDILQKITSELGEVRIPVVKGQVRVIGLLESRNTDYKVLFIPDMNSEVFPADQNKDLYLNSELRRDLGLPTFADRQELQKGYMTQIFARAKWVCLTYTKSEEAQPSIFINEILTNARYRFDENEDDRKRENIIYSPDRYLMLPFSYSRREPVQEEIIKDDTLVRILKNYTYSASSVNMIKSCELRFFYRYIRNIKATTEAVEEAGSLEIGLVLHNVLDSLFKLNIASTDARYLPMMYEIFDKEVSRYDYFVHNRVGAYEAKALKTLFPRIASAERARIEAGAVIESFEVEKRMNFHGVRIKGRIDRLDKTVGGYAVIDYKYKNYNDLKETLSFDRLDVQLPLYGLIIKAETGSYPVELLWFSLKKNPSFINAYDRNNLHIFEQELKTFFDKWFTVGVPLRGAIDERICSYCEYSTFCAKSLV